MFIFFFFSVVACVYIYFSSFSSFACVSSVRWRFFRWSLFIVCVNVFLLLVAFCFFFCFHSIRKDVRNQRLTYFYRYLNKSILVYPITLKRRAFDVDQYDCIITYTLAVMLLISSERRSVSVEFHVCDIFVFVTNRVLMYCGCEIASRIHTFASVTQYAHLKHDEYESFKPVFLFIRLPYFSSPSLWPQFSVAVYVHRSFPSFNANRSRWSNDCCKLINHIADELSWSLLLQLLQCIQSIWREKCKWCDDKRPRWIEPVWHIYTDSLKDI